MKNLKKLFLTSVMSIGLIASAHAHDPKMHEKKAEKADCSKMDHSKMDMKDPIAVAMMKKCMKQGKAPTDKMDHSKMKGMEHKKMSDEKMGKDDHKNH